MTAIYRLKLTGNDQDSTNNTLDGMSTSERLSPVHRKVGRSPEDVTEPRSEERTDCGRAARRFSIFEVPLKCVFEIEYSLTLSRSPKKGTKWTRHRNQRLSGQPSLRTTQLTRLSDDECDDPADGYDGDPDSPSLDGVGSPVNRLFVEDLEEDGSGGYEGVEDSDDDLSLAKKGRNEYSTLRAKESSGIIRTIVGKVKAAEAFNHQPVKDPYPGVVTNAPA